MNNLGIEMYMNQKKYSFIKGLKKAIISVILIGLPMVLQVLPSDVANITIGGLLVLILNWVKIQNGLKI